LPTHYSTLAEFFSAFHAIREPAAFVRTPRLPMSKAAEMVEGTSTSSTGARENYYINASPPDYDPVTKGCDSLPIGLAPHRRMVRRLHHRYALLKTGESRAGERSCAMLD